MIIRPWSSFTDNLRQSGGEWRCIQPYLGSKLENAHFRMTKHSRTHKTVVVYFCQSWSVELCDDFGNTASESELMDVNIAL
jgi:hypothetical protein